VNNKKMGSVQIPRTLAAYCVGLLLALMSGEGRSTEFIKFLYWGVLFNSCS